MTMVNISFMFALCSIVIFSNIHYVIAAGRSISDWRIRDHDITPVLGRGYSVAVGSLQSSCLNVVERTKATYDYDYFFTEIEKDNDSSYKRAWSGQIKHSLGYWWARGHVEASWKSKHKSKTEKKKHYLIATMRTERYYSSVDENQSELNEDARSLLESGQYISFFQACGPNYIRSIRRAAEVTAIFQYESTETSRNYKFESDLKLDIKGYYSRKTKYDRSYSREVDRNAMRSSLTIYIRAFGLGLNEDGAATLVARSMDDFQKVMDFAFKSMQTIGVGMVQGIEIVPWVDNPQFQVAAELDNVVQDCGDDGDEDDDGGDGDNSNKNDCSTVSMEVKKMKLSSNAEFIATMNHVMRMSIDKLYNMQQCRSLLYGFDKHDNNKSLINHRKDGGFIDNDADGTSDMTVAKLRDFIEKSAMGKAQTNIDNYLKYFYTPCMNALTADYGGQQGGTSLVKSWFSLKQCQEVTCTVAGATVDESGKCSIQDSDDASLVAEQYCMPMLVE